MALPARRYGLPALLIGLWAIQGSLLAQGLTITGHVTLVAPAGRARPASDADAVVWLTPLDENSGSPQVRHQPAPSHFRLVQKNKRFTPHILVVPVGAVVEFPNYDPFFHNVFSLFNGKRFDLGLYEAGTTRTVAFNAPGVSYIFCNIHPEMSAVIIVTQTPYYAISNATGSVTLSDVPAGRYQLNIWHERCSPDKLKALSREIVISHSSPALGELRLPQSRDVLMSHKNKYGRDYDPAESSNPAYGWP